MATQDLIDCEILIMEVEKRPALYDFQLKEYSDKNVKEKLWTEVCEAVVRDWHNLSSGEKNEKGRRLLKHHDYISKLFSNVYTIQECI